MQETVTNTNERKSLFSAYLEVLDAKDSQALAERQLQEEKQLRRTQRIYEYHERQRREAAELRRCLDLVSQHAHVLESVLRGGAGAAVPPGAAGVPPGAAGVPLGAALLRQAVSLQRCMAQCVSNAARIRQRLAAHHRDQMDAMLTKMEGELRAWTGFLQAAADAARSSETVADNLHNMIAEQRRCVGEAAASTVLQALLGPGAEAGPGGAGAGAGAGPEPAAGPSPARGPAAPAHACSTPIARA